MFPKVVTLDHKKKKMSKIKWTSLALLLLVVLDASGDAFRLNGWQAAHHVMETIQVAGWFAVWLLFRFNPVYIVMYLLGRFIGFDAIFNLITDNELFYVGESSLYGRFLSWGISMMGINMGMLIGWLKLLALIWWVAWFWTNRIFRDFKISRVE